MTARLCVTVTGETMTAVRAAQRDAERTADLVEVRLDGVEHPDVAAVLADRQRPVIVTCRRRADGGWFEGDEQARCGVLRRALELGADLVDVEWQSPAMALVSPDTASRVLVSHHAWDGVPRDFETLGRGMLDSGSRFIKIAVTAHRLADLGAIKGLDARLGASGRVVTLAMGRAGLPSRVLAAHFGSAWTYAGPLESVGQISPAALRDLYRFGRITPATSLYGVVGRPVSHSLSPVLHNTAMAARDLDAVYVPFEAESWEDFCRLADLLPIRGVSVTAPFKADAYRAAVRMAATAEATGAINTLKRTDLGWEGLNSDVAGFLAPLGAKRLDGRRAVVVGAGGAARAAAVALKSLGASTTLCSRDSGRASEAAHRVGVEACAFPPSPGSWDVLVNATPVGTWPKTTESVMEGQPLTGLLVYDLVYNPTPTRLLRDAASAGCQTIGGLDMLVAQAVAQFEWWMGQSPDAGPMRAAAEAALTAARSATVEAS